MIGVTTLSDTSLAAPPPAKSQYDQCLARVSGDPNGALQQAANWAKAGGGGGAEHCAALALVALRRYGEAGAKLDSVARSAFGANPAVRMQLYDQAGNAWLLAGRPDSAIASFSAALGVDPLEADLLADRARAYAAKQLWAKADSDLSAALMVNGSRADLYVLRGSARHALGRKADARADLDRALKLEPRNADALLERGINKYEAGDAAGGRADWQLVISINPGSPTAQTARQYLDQTAPTP